MAAQKVSTLTAWLHNFISSRTCLHPALGLHNQSTFWAYACQSSVILVHSNGPKLCYHRMTRHILCVTYHEFYQLLN